jgi:hypothetical protein
MLVRLACVLALVSLFPAYASATGPTCEKLDRGLVAMQVAQGKAYVSWRLLDSDPAAVAFNVYRRQGGKATKLTQEPVTKTTDFLDTHAPAEKASYFVRPVVDGKEQAASGDTGPGETGAANYVAVKLQGKYTFQKIAIADLDGDGRLDYVIKQPQDNIDPYEKYWKRSPDTYKLEAYRHDGKFLWRYDLGWSIERGIWYSPYVVADLDGDGRAEVAVKTGEGDPRDADGRVQTGPEYLTILDGMTGKPRTQIAWPPRSAFDGQGAYNFSSRNQLGVAYLDGRHASLIVARGTYTYMTALAYRLTDGRLTLQWRWDNTELGKPGRGQGAHWMHAVDVNADGRQEVLLGSITLDGNGKLLWNTGLGHPDSFYVGDIDPAHPGLEIYYNIERRNPRNGMCLVDAATGRILWGHPDPTRHIHSSGMCADIDASHPGCECYGGERDPDPKTGKIERWLHDSRGAVLSRDDMSLAPRVAFWDSDPQRELVRGSRIFKYRGPDCAPKLEGSVVAVADVLGDWREEIITSVQGEMRIYSTTIPARNRRTCLMQDPVYRMDVMMAPMGYYQCPMTSK